MHSFDNTDGENPSGGLIQATNGTFYGTAFQGGANGDGTIFSLSLGLGSFVKTLPTSGKVGAAVMILGTKLTGATSVTFNGTPQEQADTVSGMKFMTLESNQKFFGTSTAPGPLFDTTKAAADLWLDAQVIKKPVDCNGSQFSPA